MDLLEQSDSVVIAVNWQRYSSLFVEVVIYRGKQTLYLYCIGFDSILLLTHRKMVYNGERNRQHRHSVISAGSYENGLSIDYEDHKAHPEETHIFPVNIEDDHYEFNVDQPQ